MAPQGTLGTVPIVLPEWVDEEERYRRRYIPIAPASRIVTGETDQVAPETDIATWSVTDWSGGEGQLRWEPNGEYNTGTGAGPVTDGSGVTVGHDWDVTTSHSQTITRGGGRLVAARNMDDSIYEWNGSAWVALWNIGGSGTGNVVSMAAVDSSAWFVLRADESIRKVTSAGSTDHYAAAGMEALVAYGGAIYGLNFNQGSDLYTIDQTATDTRVKVYDANEEILVDTRVKLMSTSDVGPIWLVATNDGTTLFMEYNVADSVGYVSHDLPNDIHVYDLMFHDGIYFTAFRYADSHASSGDAYLHYRKGESRGVVGPFRADSTTASEKVAIAGVIGDRIFVVFQDRVWAYDLSSGGITLVADFAGSNVTDVYSAVTYGSLVFVGNASYVGRVDTRAYLASTAQTLSTGLHDYGYLGLPKLVHTATLSTEDVLAGSDTVELGYSVDGGSVTWLADSFTSGASYQWTVSTNSSSVIGTDIEWHVRLTTTSTTVAAKVVALASDVSGAKARIEWQILVDVGQSSVVLGDDVVSALNALKTSHAVVQWSDPFQVSEYDSPETFDVRVKDVITPEREGNEHPWATVVFQTVGVVG